MNVQSRVKVFLDKIKKEDKKINAFLEVNPNVLEEAKAVDAKKKKGRLYGKVIAVKSNINVKGLTCSCASKTLESYKASYDASVIEKIRAEDGVIIGMTNMDEFAAGWSGETSAFGPTINPVVPGHVSGGSSSGSAAAVAADFCDMALGSETGGSVRVPASFCGVVGVKPSYGKVSRYGLIDLSMSLDQVAPIAKNVEDAFLLLDVISGVDERDTKSVEMGKVKISKLPKLKIGVIHLGEVPSNVQKLIDDNTSKFCKSNSLSSSEVELAHLNLGVQTYFPIVWSEFFSATRRFDGRKYGKRIEDVAGREVLRRIYGGSEIMKAESAGRHYFKALQVAELIKEEFDEAFKKFDCLISPTSAVLPFKVGAKMSFDELAAVDKLTCPVNLAGICAVSVPSGLIDGKPVGLQIICAKGEESKLASVASAYESYINNIKN